MYPIPFQFSLAAKVRGGLRKWGSLLVLSLALAIVIIDTTFLNVSLETLIRELHTTLQSLQWVISAYSLTLAALTVTGGRLGDIFGRKRMFMLGAGLFAVGSFLASISRSVPMLIVGESLIGAIMATILGNEQGRGRRHHQSGADAHFPLPEQ